MEENTPKKSIGRPRKPENEHATYNSYTFYLPTRLKDVWEEFDLICRRNLEASFPYPERARGIIIRRLIFSKVLAKTAKENIKAKINDFIKEENAFMIKLKPKIRIKEKCK